MTTPRRPNTVEADTATLLEYVDAVVRAGIDGLVFFGSTGEFVHFDSEERMRMLCLAIKRSRVPVLVNVSHSTLAGAIQLAENAMDTGASGLLLMPPYFYHYSDEQILEFYWQFSKSLDETVPVYLYNLPFFTDPLSPFVLDRLLSSGKFVGIKDSSADWGLFEHLQNLHANQKFRLLVGSESLFLRASYGGAEGIVSGVAAAIPELMIALDRAIKAGEKDRAEHLNNRLAEFVGYVNRFPATIAIKQAAVVRGWIVNHVAVPLDKDLAAEVAAFQSWLEHWLPVVLAESKTAPVA